MFEVDEAARIITESVDPDANIIFGATLNADYTGEIKITVVATGFDEGSNKKFGEGKASSASEFKNNPFGKRAVNDTRVVNSSSHHISTNPLSQASSKSAEDDLDVPTFLRKVKK